MEVQCGMERQNGVFLSREETARLQEIWDVCCFAECSHRFVWVFRKYCLEIIHVAIA